MSLSITATSPSDTTTTTTNTSKGDPPSTIIATRTTSSSTTSSSLVPDTLSHANSTFGAGTTGITKTATGTSTRSTATVLAIPSSSTKSESKPKTAPIAAGVVGGISLLCLVLVFIIWYRRRQPNFPGNKLGGVSAYSIPTNSSKNIDKANPGNGVLTLGSGRHDSNEMAHSDTSSEATNANPSLGRPGMTASNGITAASPDPSSLTSGAPAQAEGQTPHTKGESSTLPSFQPQESGPQSVPGIISPNAAEGVSSPNSFAPAMSLMMQEMESLRARLAQIEQRQPHEAHALSFNASGIDEDDRQTAPPAYSDDGGS